MVTFEDRLSTFKSKFNIATDLTEQDLAVDRHLSKCSYFSKSAVLRGKLDRLLLTEDGKTAVVIDLKTGKKATLQYSADQLNFYATLVLGNYPEVTMVRSALYFTRLDTMLWDTARHRKTYSMDESNSVVTKINSLTDDFVSNEEATIRIQNMCKWLSLIHISEPTRPY